MENISENLADDLLLMIAIGGRGEERYVNYMAWHDIKLMSQLYKQSSAHVAYLNFFILNIY